MKILLDECMPKAFGYQLDEHWVRTVHSMGCSGKKNGKLLTIAQESFDVMITVDQNLHHQQTIQNYDIAVLTINCRSIRLADLLPFASKVQTALKDAQPGTLIIVE